GWAPATSAKPVTSSRSPATASARSTTQPAPAPYPVAMSPSSSRRRHRVAGPSGVRTAHQNAPSTNRAHGSHRLNVSCRSVPTASYHRGSARRRSRAPVPTAGTPGRYTTTMVAAPWTPRQSSGFRVNNGNCPEDAVAAIMRSLTAVVVADAVGSVELLARFGAQLRDVDAGQPLPARHKVRGGRSPAAHPPELRGSPLPATGDVGGLAGPATGTRFGGRGSPYAVAAIPGQRCRPP